MTMFAEVYCIVYGKVQGVGYRDFVTRQARDLSLTGWIRNTDTGSVELLAQGTPDTLKTFVEAVHEGSVLAQVDSVAVDWRTPVVQYEDFSVISSV